MAKHAKALVVFENPATLRELTTSAAGRLEILPLRDRRQAVATIKAYADIIAVIVEQTAQPKLFLEVLQNLQAAHPGVRRIVVANSSDLFCVIEGVHTGAIDAVVYRPIDARQLLPAVLGGTASAAPIPRSQPSPPRRIAS
jgi:DNA-binding NtrC family response regulator